MKTTVKWSKKENDWVCKYPDRNGRLIGDALFTMIDKFEEFMKTDHTGGKTDFTNFRDYLTSAGYDPDSFNISVKKKS